MANLTDILTQELINLYPDLKLNLAQRYATKYVSAVIAEIQQGILRLNSYTDQTPDEISIRGDDLQRTSGRVKYQNKTFYLLNFMDRSEKTRLFQTKFRGSPHRYKTIELNQRYLSLILNLLNQTNIKPNPIPTKANQMLTRHIIVDVSSLQSYISQIDIDIQQNSGQTLSYVRKLLENKQYALQLLGLVQARSGQDIISDNFVRADTGREYHTGRYNLQQAPSQVREAALGPCHKYDFKAQSFSIMASWARQIDPEIKIGAILDYIKHRQRIRQRLAKLLGVHENVMKSIFTSLGFGARVIAHPRTAIAKKITQAQMLQLKSDLEFSFILDDLKRISDTIITYFSEHIADSEGNFVLCSGQTYLSRDPETNRKKNNRQMLAWIYQNSEAWVTQKFIDQVRIQQAQEPRLTVHDCVYYSEPLATETLLSVYDTLSQQGFDLCKIEHTKVYPQVTAEYKLRIREQQLREELEHKEFIRSEESRALGYKPSDLIQISGTKKMSDIELHYHNAFTNRYYNTTEQNLADIQTEDWD